MSPLLQEAIGAGFGGAVTLLIVAIIVFAGKLGHLPKRADRLEAVIPPLLRAVLALLKCQKEGKCNGDIELSISELNKLMSDGVISKKAQ